MGDDRRILHMCEVLRVVDLGIVSADAESVQLQYQFGDLVLRYTDWQEVEREKKFHDVLAFRWQEFTDDAPRNDVSYEVENSGWLRARGRIGQLRSLSHLLQSKRSS